MSVENTESTQVSELTNDEEAANKDLEDKVRNLFSFDLGDGDKTSKKMMIVIYCHVLTNICGKWNNVILNKVGPVDVEDLTKNIPVCTEAFVIFILMKLGDKVLEKPPQKRGAGRPKGEESISTNDMEISYMKIMKDCLQRRKAIMKHCINQNNQQEQNDENEQNEKELAERTMKWHREVFKHIETEKHIKESEQFKEKKVGKKRKQSDEAHEKKKQQQEENDEMMKEVMKMNQL